MLVKSGNLEKPLRFDAMVKESIQLSTQTFEDRTYYFEYNSTGFEANPPFNRYVVELKDYLAKNKEKKVKIIGHTDTDGSADANYLLGMNRAKSIKKHLIASGIPNSKVTLESKGETQPAASNETSSGKARNNRVDVRIK